MPWSKPSSKTSATPLIFAASLIMVFSGALSVVSNALAEDSCASNPYRMNAVIQLTRTGQEKLTRVAYEEIRRSMDDILSSVPKETQEFGADPKCKRANYSHLTEKEISDDCFGFLPERIWDAENRNGALDRLEPVLMKMTNMKVNRLDINQKPDVSCRNNICEITASVDQFDMKFDMSARSVNEENCALLGLKDVSLKLKGKNNGAKVKIKMRLTGNVFNPVEMIAGESQFVLPVSAVKYHATSVTQDQDSHLCKRNPGIQRSAADIVGDVVANNQFILNMILDGFKDSVFKPLVDQEATEFAKANGVGKDKYINPIMPSMKDVPAEILLDSFTKDKVAQADQYLNALLSARSSTNLPKNLDKNLPMSNIAELMAKHKDAPLSTTMDNTLELGCKWRSASEEVARLEPKTTDPEMKSAIRAEKARIKTAMNELDTYRNIIRSKLDKAGDTDGEKMAVVLSAIQANNLQSEIQTLLSACYRCRKTGIVATDGAEWGFDKGDHDVAFKTGYGTINQFLAVMQASNGLDLCVVQGSKKECKDAGPNDVKIDVHFPNAPEIFWNEASNSIAFRVKQIQLTNQHGDLGNIARKMTADIVLPGDISLAGDLKTLQFSPIADKIKVSNPDFKAAEWDPLPLQPISGLVAWAAERMADTAFAHNLMKKALTVDVEMPETASITKLKATPKGFGVYMNLPDDPDLMLPDGPADRSLATTTKCKKFKKLP